MKAFIMLMLIGISFSQAVAQGTDVSNVKFISSVYLFGSDKPLKGAIVTTGDSIIQLIAKSLLRDENIIADGATQVIPIASISHIKTRRRKSAGRGAVRGLFTGAVIGAIIAGASSDENDFFSPGGQAVLGFIGGSIPGLIAGTIVGASIKTTFKINGDPALYTLNREEIKKYTVTGN